MTREALIRRERFKRGVPYWWPCWDIRGQVAPRCALSLDHIHPVAGYCDVSRYAARVWAQQTFGRALL